MLYIKHRINTINDLKSVPQNMGIEVDIRYEGNKLILHHDPFVSGEDFEAFLQEYKHAFIILNIKSEGIEEKTLQLINKHNIKEYFLLDITFPQVVKLSKAGNKNIAIRFSEYEPIEQALRLKGLVNWVWIDCFNDLPLNEKTYLGLKKYFKICIVSPELQKHSTDTIPELKKILSKCAVDAICTKVPELWKK